MVGSVHEVVVGMLRDMERALVGAAGGDAVGGDEVGSGGVHGVHEAMGGGERAARVGDRRMTTRTATATARHEDWPLLDTRSRARDFRFFLVDRFFSSFVLFFLSFVVLSGTCLAFFRSVFASVFVTRSVLVTRFVLVTRSVLSPPKRFVFVLFFSVLSFVFPLALSFCSFSASAVIRF